MDEIKKILVQKAYQNKLGHFYHLTSYQKKPDQAIEWAIDLIKKIRENTGHNLSQNQVENHQDLLIIKPLKKTYRLDDISSLENFLKYKATEFSRKYIIIQDIETISITIANKILKVLEEPPVEVCILGLNTSGKDLIQTLESRAIKVYLPLTKISESEQAQSLDELIKLSFIEFETKIKKTPSLEQDLQQLLTQTTHKDHKFGHIERVHEYLKRYEQDQDYNNSPTTRLMQLHYLLRQA